MGKEITRAEVADIFYHDYKLRKLYSGRIPKSLDMSEVRTRLKKYTKAGKLRKKR